MGESDCRVDWATLVSYQKNTRKLGMKMSEIEKLAKELQEYTIFLGSHKHIQNVANRLVELTKQPQLNENQKDLVVWMQDNECSVDDPLESISDLFLEGTPSEYFPDLPLSCVEAAYQSLSKKQKLELVQEYVMRALEQEVAE